MAFGASPHGGVPHGSRLRLAVTGTPGVADWCAQGQSWLLAQFRGKPVLETLLCILLDQLTELEQLFADMVPTRALATAQGVNLDEIGRRLGFERTLGQSDTSYRATLRGVAQARLAHGDPDTMIEILQVLLPGIGITFTEDYPAYIVVTLVGGVSVGDGGRAARILRIAKPAAVGFHLEYEPLPFDVLPFDDDPVRPILALPESGDTTGAVLAEADSGRD